MPQIDPVEEVIEEKIEDIIEEPVVTKEVEDRTEKIVQEIKDKLDGKAQPTPEQMRAFIRDKIKKDTSMTDAQIDYMDQRINEVAAPLYAKDTFNEWKETVSDHLTPDVEKEIKEELKQYPSSSQTDKVLLNKILWMTLGKREASGKKAPIVTKKEETIVNQGGPANPVIGRKIVPTHGSATGLATGTASKTGAASLTEAERVVARKMRMTEEEYAHAKTSPVISDLKKK